MAELSLWELPLAGEPSTSQGGHKTRPYAVLPQLESVRNCPWLNNGDVEVTTDFRRVLSEVLIRRLGNPDLGAIFRGYAGYAPLCVVNGTDLPPVLGNSIFGDGFESGNTSAWQTTVG